MTDRHLHSVATVHETTDNDDLYQSDQFAAFLALTSAVYAADTAPTPANAEGSSVAITELEAGL